EAKAVLLEILHAAIDGRHVGRDTELLAKGISNNRKWVLERDCHKWFHPATYIGYVLGDLLSAQNQPGFQLRYPDFRLRTGVKVTPVYEKVASFIDRLEGARQSEPGVPHGAARAELIRARNAFGA